MSCVFCIPLGLFYVSSSTSLVILLLCISQNPYDSYVSLNLVYTSSHHHGNFLGPLAFLVVTLRVSFATCAMVLPDPPKSSTL
ncbi:hypothetical protein HanPI659440_Chr17g0692751 [Helianthus annuus]|nr:hypothetical protein HanPI659440_Chr17g0692751 [Helianthus annuus]